MGNRQRAVQGASLRLDIVAQTRAGLTNAEIAKKFGVTTMTVARHQKRFLETDSKYPPNLGPEDILLMRSEQRELLEAHLRNIAQSVTNLSEPKSFSEEAKRIEVFSRASESVVRISERLSRLFGLDATIEPSTVNNTQVNLSGPTMELLQHFNRIQDEKRTRFQPDTRQSAIE